MKLYNIFNEDWQTVRGYDKERYTELPGLDGPISTKSGKVLYYDTKQGQYYDRDSDMYMDHDDALAFLNEDFEAEFGVPLVEKNKVASTGKTERILSLMQKKYPQAENEIEALLLHFDNGQARDRVDINRLSSENDAEEQEIEALQKQLDKLKARRGIGEAESNKERAERAAMAKIQDQFKDLPKYTPQSAEERAKAHKEREERAMAKAKENADMLMKLADKHGESISASEVGYFAKGIADGKRGYSDPKAGDALGPNVYAYDAGVRVGEKLGASVNEDYYETDEQRELARLGRILKDMGKKRDDDVGEAMGFLGTQLTRYGTPQGVNSIEKLVKVTGQPESVIMKMLALAQKVQGDVAVGDNVPDEDELEEADFDTNFKKRVGYTVKGGAASDMMKQQAAQAQANNPDAGTGLGPSVLNIAKARKKAAEKGVRAPSNLRSSPNTKDPKRLPEDELSEGPAGRGRPAGRDQYRTGTQGTQGTQGATDLTQMTPQERKAAETAAEKVSRGQTNLTSQEKAAMAKSTQMVAKTQASTTGRSQMAQILKQSATESGVNEAPDHDIKIGDTVQTLKMGQMQGTVTGFTKKGGIDKVMFKHESGKVYATVPDNLKVISSKKSESQVAENIDLRHNLQPGTYKHNEENITVTINSDSSVSFKQPAEWEIEGDGEYLEFVETQLADASNWTAVVEEAKKKPVPTKPDKWAYAKAQAKKKFDVYPSAYANAWAAKKYKELGGGWRMGNPKKK